MRWCVKCGSFISSDRECQCKSWKIWCEDDDEEYEDAVVVHAHHITDAVKKWAAAKDAEGDFPIAGCASVDVWVDSDGDVTRVRVSGEAIVRYSAEVVS